MFAYRHILAFLIGALFFGITLANTSETTDFFQANTPQLAKIESYHLQRADKQLQLGNLNYALSEYCYVLHYYPNHPVALQKLMVVSMQLQQPEQALKYFDKALKLYPAHAATYGLYGKVLFDLQHFDQAILQFQQAILFDPNTPEYHYELGLAYFALQKFEQANKEAQTAYQLGYTSTGLKEKLITVDAWKPAKKHS